MSIDHKIVSREMRISPLEHSSGRSIFQIRQPCIGQKPAEIVRSGTPRVRERGAFRSHDVSVAIDIDNGVSQCLEIRNRLEAHLESSR